MKKTLLKILALCTIVCCMLCVMTGCTQELRDDQIVAIYNLYAESVTESGETPLSYDEWVKNIKGADGIDGHDGVSVVKVEKTNTVGLIDTYTITYSDGSTTSFLITNGEKGDDGKSAYEIWLDNGHEGSEEDFLNWLKGGNGKIPELRYDEETGFVQWKYTDEGDDAWRNLVMIGQGNNSSAPLDDQSWKDAFDALSLNNLSVDLQVKYDEDTVVNNELKISEDAIYTYYENGNYISYYMKKEDGSFDNYKYFEEEQYNFAAQQQWTRLYDDSSMYYDWEIQEMQMLDFSESFDKLVYDAEKGAYVSSEEMTVSLYVIEEGEKYEIGEVTVSSAEITVSEGKIVRIDCNYNMVTGDGSVNITMSVFDIGTTVVTLPDEVLENAVQQPAPIYN